MVQEAHTGMEHITKKRKESITRAVLSGLAAGAFLAVPLAGNASAQTLTQYQESLAKAATVADVYGGNYINSDSARKTADVASVGNLHLDQGGSITGNVYGGSVVENTAGTTAYQSNVTGLTTLNINGTVTGAVHGGGYAAGSTTVAGVSASNTQARTAQAVINIGDGADVKAVFGGGRESYVVGDNSVSTTGDATVTYTTINLNGGKVGVIAGGNDTQGTKNSTDGITYLSQSSATININGGEVGDIRAAGGTYDSTNGFQSSDAHIRQATINLIGGKVTGDLVGIGANTETGRNATLNISGQYNADGYHLHAIRGFNDVNIKSGANVTVDASSSVSNGETDKMLYAGTSADNGNTKITSEAGSTLTVNKPLVAFNGGTLDLRGTTNVNIASASSADTDDTNRIIGIGAVQNSSLDGTGGTANLSGAVNVNIDASRTHESISLSDDYHIGKYDLVGIGSSDGPLTATGKATVSVTNRAGIATGVVNDSTSDNLTLGEVDITAKGTDYAFGVLSRSSHGAVNVGYGKITAALLGDTTTITEEGPYALYAMRGTINAGTAGKALQVTGTMVAEADSSTSGSPVLNLTLGNGSVLKGNVLGRENGTVNLKISNGVTFDGTQFRVAGGTDKIGGTINIAVANGAVLDLTNVYSNGVQGNTFLAKRGSINLMQGTIVTSAAAFGYEEDGLININGAAVKLAKGDAFTYVSASDRQHRLVLNSGSLEGPSSTFFQTSLGNGTVTDPVGVNDAAYSNILPVSGQIILDDGTYNLTYLSKAKDYIHTLYSASGTIVTAVGTLVDSSGNVQTSANIGDVPTDTLLQHVRIDNGKANLSIGSSSTGDSTTAAVAPNSSFGAEKLNLAANNGSNKIQVQAGKKLILGGAEDGNLVLVDGAAPSVPVVVTVTGSGSELQLGTAATTNTLAADITVGDAATASILSAAGGTQTTGSVTVKNQSRLEVASGTSLAATDGVTLESGSTMQLNGTMTGTKLTAAGATILVGTDTTEESAAGSLVLGEDSTLTGSSIFLDPSWESTAASEMSYAGSTVDYTLTVGQYSEVSLGTTSTTAVDTYIAEAGHSLASTDVTAALYLAEPVTITAGSGGIKVDGSLTTDNVSGNYASADTATFAAQSLLLLNGANTTGITATAGTLTVSDGAMLYIADAKANTTYTVASGFTTAQSLSANSWAGSADDIILNKLEQVSAVDSSTTAGTVTVTTKAIAASTALPEVNIPHVLDAMIANQQNSTSSANAGIKYLSQAITASHTDAESTALLNAAAAPAESTGATVNALNAALGAAETAQQHFSVLDDVENTHGSDVWAKYIHNKNRVNGMEIGRTKTDYTSNSNGFIVGFDLPRTSGWKSGLAIGYTENNAGSSLQHDKGKTWSAAYYGNIRNGRNNLLADIGYSETEHDITGTITADPKTKIFTIGVRDELLYGQKEQAVVPHVGLRYLNIGDSAYTGKASGADAFHYDTERRSVWLLPVGVGFTHNQLQKNGGKLSFTGDLSYVSVMGGRTGHTTVTVPGINASDDVSFDFMDRGSFLGSLGIRYEKQNISYGIGYSYQKGSSSESNRLMVNFNYRF